MARPKKEIVFVKLIDNPFSFGGKIYKDKEFSLSVKEAEHIRIKNAIKSGLIKQK